MSASDVAAIAAAKRSGPARATASSGGRLVSLVDGKEYATDAGITIGRDASAEIVVAQTSVSRRHAQVVASANGYVVNDLSTNGLFVNGEKVNGSQPLSRADVIRVGTEEFRFYADVAPVVPKAAAPGGATGCTESATGPRESANAAATSRDSASARRLGGTDSPSSGDAAAPTTACGQGPAGTNTSPSPKACCAATASGPSKGTGSRCSCSGPGETSRCRCAGRAGDEEGFPDVGRATSRRRRRGDRRVLHHPPLRAMLRLKWAARSDVGMIRSGNEDNHDSDVNATRGVFIVADGMGGHAAGEVASLMAVQTVMQELAEMREIDDAGKAAARLSEALRTANRNIHDRTLSESDKQGMGTTASVLVIDEKKYLIGQVGDSRVYLLRDGGLHQLTKDHSYVQEQVDAGFPRRSRRQVSVQQRDHPLRRGKPRRGA